MEFDKLKIKHQDATTNQVIDYKMEDKDITFYN